MKTKYISGLLVIAVLAGGIYFFRQPDYQSWLIAQDKPLLALLDGAAKLYFKGDYSRAAAEYEKAIEQAQNSDLAATEKWRKLAVNRQSDPQSAPSTRLFSLKETALYRGGVNYFKARIAEAAYGLALTKFDELKTRYNLSDPNAFVPPETEMTATMKAIELGLTASPQSESLRLLKAEILAVTRRYPQAIAVLNETLLIDSQSAEAYNQLGLIYSSPAYMSDPDQWQTNQKTALAMFEKSTTATALNGGRLPDPFFNLGIFYATPLDENGTISADDTISARRYLEEFLKITAVNDRDDRPDVKIAAAVLKRLKK